MKRRRRVAGALLPLVAALGGCAGGRVDVISLDFRNIDGPDPVVHRIPLDDCCWWLDEDGKVCIAMERRGMPDWPLGPFRFEMSLVLERPPAGQARNYSIDSRALRAVARLMFVRSHFTSRVGILALYRERPDRLRGSLRIQVESESPQLLGGWSRSRYLMLARFHAVHDPRRGREILARTEERGWERDAPATRPALQEPSAMDAGSVPPASAPARESK
jgi:hypothetical protein